MKSYSFYFNTSDWLGSQAVKQMSKAERGTFIDLLALAWGRENQLPASDDKVRRLAEMSAAEWAESGEVLLEQFPLSPCGTYRFNPRLQLEVAKEQRKSEVAQEKANKRWQSPGNAAASKPNAVASKTVCRGNAQEQVQEQDTTVVVRATADQPLKAKSKAEQQAVRAAAEGLDTFTAENWPGLNDPQKFALICKSLAGLKLPVNLDTEAYREAIRQRVLDRGMNVPATSLRNFIESFFMKLPTAELRTMDAAMPTVPTPRHELPRPGHERPGQVIAIAGVVGDVNMNRMKIESMQRHFPTATIHAILPR